MFKTRIPLMLVIAYMMVLFSCGESNKLKQENAEKVIRDFVAKEEILVQGHGSGLQIIAIAKLNVYSQFYTNVKVSVADSTRQTFTLLFDFNRSPKNKWVLQKVESADVNTALKRQVIAHNNLNIATQ